MEIRSWLPPWIRSRRRADRGLERVRPEATEVRAPAAGAEPTRRPEDRGPRKRRAGAQAELRARREEIVRMEERALRAAGVGRDPAARARAAPRGPRRPRAQPRQRARMELKRGSAGSCASWSGSPGSPPRRPARSSSRRSSRRRASQAGLTLQRDRGGDQAGGRAPGPRHPRGRDAAPGRRPRPGRRRPAWCSCPTTR